MSEIRYRREIDGLRAIAVLPVILFHAGLQTFAGGFMGVDVFFVISGYLITGIVLGEIDAGTFSIWKFYDRRARRILPALLTVIALTTLVSTLLMAPGQLKEFGQSAVASLLFSANIFFWLKLDYWGQSSDLVPLLHLWSLGVEEQFYLLTPLIALVASRRRVLLAMFAGVAVASFAAMLYAHHLGHQAAAFYLLPFRAWEIAVGALAALLQRRLKPAKIRDDVASAGALLVLIAAVLLLDDKAAPALIFGIPVLCTFVLVLLCRNGATARLLGWQPLVTVGLISYSLYLYHQPILALLRIASPRPLDLAQVAAAIILTFVSAALTYRFIETPCRRPSKRPIRPLYLFLAGSTALLLAAGFLLVRTDGLREQKLASMDPRLQTALVALEEERAMRERLWKTYLLEARKPFGETELPKVLFAGDSLSEDLFVAATMGANGEVVARRIALDDECVRTDGKSGEGKDAPTCKEELEAFLGSDLLRDADVVVFANAWLTNASALEKVFGYPPMRGKRVVVYETHAFLDMLSVIMNLGRFKLDEQSADLQRFVYLNRHQRTLTANATLQEVADRHHAATIDAFDFFCDNRARRCRLFTPQGRPVVIDQSHLSTSGMDLFQPWFVRELRHSLAAPPPIR
ncbi:MAG: acyltransferase family protein [Phenylobacterium sp.]